MNTVKRAYSELLEVCEKYSEVLKLDEQKWSDSPFHDIKKMRENAKKHLMLCELEEKYGIEIPHWAVESMSDSWVKINGDMGLQYFRNAQEESDRWSWRFVTWPDDGRQPMEEWLLVIGFGTWAYIFGEDYPKETFDAFFEELKTFGAKFSDSHNHYLYFPLENANSVIGSYPGLLSKYRQKASEERKIEKVRKLREELERLEKSDNA